MKKAVISKYTYITARLSRASWIFGSSGEDQIATRMFQKSNMKTTFSLRSFLILKDYENKMVLSGPYLITIQIPSKSTVAGRQNFLVAMSAECSCGVAVHFTRAILFLLALLNSILSFSDMLMIFTVLVKVL